MNHYVLDLHPKPIALWAVPRSVSTAFERMMIERSDFEVLDEPFFQMYHSRDSENLHSSSEALIEGCFGKFLEKANSKKPIFFKDMAYHVSHISTPAFLGNFTNTFIIRHPALTIPSHYLLNPDFVLVETGYEAQFELFSTIFRETGQAPVIIDAEELRRFPEATVKSYCKRVSIKYLSNALSWNTGVKSQWKDGKLETWSTESRWYEIVSQSEGFLPPQKNKPPLDNPKMLDACRYCLPFYQELYKYRIPIVA